MAKKIAKTVTAINVAFIIATKIAELESQACECVTDTNEIGEVVKIKCDRCNRIDELKKACVCGKCDDCLHILLEHHKSQQCTCTYKTIQVEETIINEHGEEEVVLVDKDAVDVMCERCKTIISIEKQLDDRETLRKAYIDEVDFDEYEVVDGAIRSKVVEEGKKSEIDMLKETISIEQLVQDCAIDMVLFEVIPSIEARLPISRTKTSIVEPMIAVMNGGDSMAAYFFDRISRGVVTYTACFNVSHYKKYQTETDVLLELEGFGHLIVR